MSTTPSGWIEHINESQSQKEVTANTGYDTLEDMLAGSVSIDLQAESGDYTLTTAQAEHLRLYITGSLSGAVNLIVPAQSKLYLLDHSGSTNDVTIKTAAGTGVTLSPTQAQFIYCDGTDCTAYQTTGYGSSTEATPKTKATATGAGGTSDIAIGANADPNTVEVVVDKLYLEKDYDFTVTESVGASGNYDQITPGVDDMFPAGSRVVIYYYPA